MLIKELVYEFDAKDKKEIDEKFALLVSPLKKAILFIPAILGIIFHFPLYYPIKKITAKTTAKNDHYDSVLVALLIILYPLYLLLIICLTALFVTGWCWLLTLITLPFFAWSYLQLKK